MNGTGFDLASIKQELDGGEEIFSLLNYFSFTTKDFNKDETHSIRLFDGYIGDTEIVRARLEFGNKSKTIVLEKSKWNEFIEAWKTDIPELQQAAVQWGLQRTNNADLYKAGYVLTVGRPGFIYADVRGVSSLVPIELPASAIYVEEESQLDRFTDGDFKLFHSQSENLQTEFSTLLKEANRLATKLGILCDNKNHKIDHDLVLSFKANSQYKGLIVGLTKVYPKLPEGGELVVGDESIELSQWDIGNPAILSTVKKLKDTERQTTKLFMKMRSLVNPDPYFQDLFDTEVKKLLVASSSFLKTVYKFNGAKNNDVVEEVVNDVLGKLSKLEGEVGLDVTEWAVYRYHSDKAPTRVTDPEVNFVESILNVYTPSFVEVLTDYFLNHVTSPMVRPYSHREVVEIDDGIEEGSIRQV